MQQKNLIITFTRNPELGKVKTRLAKTIGNPSALAIYKKLLKHTESVLRPLSCDKAVYYSVKIRENDIWDSNIYQKHQQILLLPEMLLVGLILKQIKQLLFLNPLLQILVIL